MKINNNLSAMFAHRQVQNNFLKVGKSIEKLSTGLRINRAGDDATNLAVSEKMRTQIRGLRQAERNAMNGISFIQVAESGMVQVNDMVQRIRELAIQAANGIYSTSDRIQIQVEVSQLIDEVDRVSTTVQFNRRKILTGDYAKDSARASMFFHVGPNQNQRIRAYVSTMNAQSLGFYQADQKQRLTNVGEANQMVGVVDNALDKLNRQRADLGAYHNRLESTAQSLRSNYENMVAAESRIRDADMAEELIEYTKNQVLLQSSTAMLAQANFSSRLVLNLLDNIS